MSVRAAFVPPLILGVVCLVACGDEPQPSGGEGETTSATPLTGVLTLARPDGSSETIEGVDVVCKPSESDGSVTRIHASNPRSFSEDGEELTTTFFMFEAALDDVHDEKTFDLPTGGSEDAHDVVLFAVDARDQNELSGAQDDATGTVKVVTASCGATPSLTLVVDAHLGSEFGDMDGADLKGSLELSS